jgi:hypothetical protein
VYRIAIISALTFLSVVPAFQLGIIYGFYALNKVQITNEYCVNIDKPQLMCSGKCYVNEIVAPANDTGTSKAQLPISLDFQQITPCLIDDNLLPAFGVRSYSQPLPAILNKTLYKWLFAAAVFKPPKV